MNRSAANLERVVLVVLVLLVGFIFFLFSQIIGIFYSGALQQARAAYAGARLFVALSLMSLVISLWATCSDYSRETDVRAICAGFANFSLFLFMGAVVNLMGCAFLARHEATRLAREAAEGVPVLGLNSADERRSETP